MSGRSAGSWGTEEVWILTIFYGMSFCQREPDDPYRNQCHEKVRIRFHFPLHVERDGREIQDVSLQISNKCERSSCSWVRTSDERLWNSTLVVRWGPKCFQIIMSNPYSSKLLVGWGALGLALKKRRSEEASMLSSSKDALVEIVFCHLLCRQSAQSL